ncbi:hypothetical protein V2J09_010243 [Rumex salicifolius]
MVVASGANSFAKEMSIRRRISNIFNKREEEFSSLREYNDYLEEVEDMICNLVDGIDVPAIEAKIAQYEKENAEQIMNARARKAEELAAALAASKGPQTDNKMGVDPNSQQMEPTSTQGHYAPAVAGGAFAQPRPTGLGPQPWPHEMHMDEEEMRLRAERGARAGGWSPELGTKRALEEAFGRILSRFVKILTREKKAYLCLQGLNRREEANLAFGGCWLYLLSWRIGGDLAKHHCNFFYPNPQIRFIPLSPADFLRAENLEYWRRSELFSSSTADLPGSLVDSKMNSNITVDSVHMGKLLIHVAENGHSYEVDCEESTHVEAIQQYMESMAGIPLSDQLLLCADMKLETHEPLSAYKLPSDQEEVFCFNKARLQANAQPPPTEQLEIREIPEPPPPSSSTNPHPLDDAMDPALKALPSYERQFRHHYHCGHAIYNRTVLKYENCQKVLREQKVQERGMEIAGRNLERFFTILYQNYMEFLKCFSQQYRMHSDLLMNFTRDIEKLRVCKLISALQTSSRRCLLDLVKEDNLRKLAENCSNSHRQFESKVAQFKHVFGRLKQDVEDLFSSKASLPIREMELMIGEHQQYINEQKSIMQSLSKDVSTVKKLVDDCVASQLSSSLRPHDAVSALGPMYEVHEKNHLPRMRSCDQSINDLLNLCGSKKNEMNNFVHSYMQKVAFIQHNIKDVRLQFNAFSEALKRQDVLFEGLRLVRMLGSAYRACLAEVVRRKASMKLYMGMAGQLAEMLAAKREIELKKREEFFKAQIRFIPRDILASMGLFDTPSQCDVNIVPFDTNLLDIDIVDIDRYAPEHLFGLPFKSEKQASPRSSFSGSHGSAHSSDHAMDALEKYGSDDLLEVCDLIEVAGTGKLEVENAKLKADLASAIATICSFSPDFVYGLTDDSEMDSFLKNTAEKTAEALQSKDEYTKHLLSELKARQMQSESYKKRIQELEQQLSDQFMKGSKFPENNHAISCSANTDEQKSEISVHENAQLYTESGEPMDEVSSTSNPLDDKLEPCSKLTRKSQEGVDENMADSPRMLHSRGDSCMMEPLREEEQIEQKYGDDKLIQISGGTGADSVNECLNTLHPELQANEDEESKSAGDLVLELQIALEEKTNQLSETESRLKSAIDEVARLGRELETSRNLLDESQLNCAHLENCLHEAREEAQTHLCAANRKASEYNTLRESAVKMRSLLKRLKSSVSVSGGVPAFADSLRSLAQSLSNLVNENKDDFTIDFRACVRVLAERVGILSRQRAELLERCSKAESGNKLLTKEVEEHKDLVKTLYTKHQVEKQANKEKISFCRFEVHEIAAFVQNEAGHYEAISKDCSNYYLSVESVALFTDHLPSRPTYIVGQIVHIERQVVKSQPSRTEQNRGDAVDLHASDSITNRLALNPGLLAANPYGLPIGCEYFVVTIAMLPGTSIHSTAS